jgi:hypothetical protein
MVKAVKTAAEMRAELKAFEKERKALAKSQRHQLAILKRKGVLPKTVDVRRVEITPHYKSVIKKNLGIIEGRETAVKLTPEKVKEYKAGGHRVVGKNRVVVQKHGNEQVHVSHGEVYVTRALRNGEIQRVVLPVSFDRLSHWLDGAEDPYLETLKNNKESFAFRYFGNNSIGTFHTFEALRREMEHYKSFTGAIEKGRGAEQKIVQHIEVVRIKMTESKWEELASQKNKEKRKQRRDYHKARKEGSPIPRKPRGPDLKPRKQRETPAIPKHTSEEQRKAQMREAAKRYRQSKKK